MIPTKRLLFLVIFLFLFLARLGQAQFSELPAAPDAVRAALLDGDYEGARAALIELRNTRPEHADFCMYLYGRAYEMEGNAARAAGRYNALASGHPDSPWRHKADYRRAELLRELGAIEEAEAVWSAALERLRGLERQDALAEVYLSAADEIVAGELTPDAENTDWGRAADLYSRALELGLSEGPRDRALRGRLRCMEERKHWPEVVNTAKQWIKSFGGLDENGLPPRGDEGIQMLVTQARAHVMFGDFALGRRVLEDLLRDAERSAQAGESTLNEWPKWRAEATYWLARSWYDDPARSVAVYQRYLDGTPAPRSMEVHHEIAQQWQRAGRSEAALVAYDALLQHEPEAGTEAPSVAQREAETELRMRALYEKGLLLAQLERHDEAISTLQSYATRYPSGPHWTAAQRAIETTLIAGIEQLASEEREAEERAAIESFLAERPLHNRAAELRLRIGESWRREGYRLSDNLQQPDEVWKPAMLTAVAEFERVVKKYTGTDSASQALYLIGNIHEHDLGDPRAAIEAYRRCNFGGWNQAADERRREMTTTELDVATERAWRSNETPRLELMTRNLEQLEVRIYDLSLESYFRKYSTHESVEDLDLDLIAPDQRIELTVPDYAPYAPIEFEPELPLQGPGVWAVTVVGEELTATTLVIVSDIDVIAKVGAEEVFVFAQDMLTDRPAADVRVLCALPKGDGVELHEASTDESGVVRFSCDVEETWMGASVLAMRGDDVAACGEGFGPLLARSDETHRVFAHTERHVYRRGDDVHWRVVARRLVDGVDQVPVGLKYDLSILDPNGRPVWESTQLPSEFGSMHGSLTLSEHSPLGQYSLICAYDGRALSTTPFQVQEFQLQRIALELSSDQDVYYRGETILFEASARFHYGSPVAHAPLQVTLPDGRRIELHTDEYGVAEYEYDTREHLQARSLQFAAVLSDENVRSQHAVYLATEGFQLFAQADRDAVAVGDELLATIRATAPDGEPLSRELRAEWMQLVDAPRGGTVERRVERADLTTDELGEARIAFRPAEAGNYLLRVMGDDRFGNPIVGKTQFEVAGEDDPQRLRFFTERRQYSVGETAELELVDRMDPGLALITIETDRVLSYRIARLEQGKNLLRIELLNEHAPNIRVAVGKMSRDGFEFDHTELDVNRALRVAIQAPESPVAPGSQVPITLIVTDLLGEPVEAELSLAIIDEALYDLFPHVDPRILRTFRLVRRNFDSDPLRTASSCDFAYFADTETIAAALIAEQLRQEEEQRWEDRRKQAVGALAELSSKSAFAGPGDFALGLEIEEEPEEVFNDAIGLGGGAGGTYGGRFGGKRSLRASGGKAGGPSLADTEWLDEITAYWNPAVRTDSRGRATVQVTLPDRSTRWRLTSHGASRDSAFGDAEAELVTRSDLFVEILAPLALTKGDLPTFVARVHNPAGLTGELQLRLQHGPAIDELTVRSEAVALNGDPLVEVDFPLREGVTGAEWLITLDASGTLSSGEVSTGDRRRLSVRPWGLEVRASRSGVLATRVSQTLVLPEDSNRAGRTLRLRVGRGLDEALLDALLGRGPHYHGPRSTIATVTDEAWTLIGLLELLQMSGASVDAAPGQYAELLGRARGSVALLLSNRLGTDGWPGCYGENESDPLTTAAVAIALGRAREFGLAVPSEDLSTLRSSLREHFRTIGASETEEKALYLHAMARVDSATTDYTSRLFRERAQLSTTALAHLALALSADGRAPLAAEVAEAIESRVDDEGQLSSRSQLAFHGISVERRALALWALHTARPDSAAALRLSDSLLADRPWAPRRARGIAVAALAGMANRPGDDSPVEVVVRVDDRPARTIRLDDRNASDELTFVFGEDDPEELQLDLELRGTGSPHYVAELSGSAPVAEDLHNELAQVWRLRYVAAAPLYRGRPLPVGFDTVGNPNTDADRNPRRECELGARFELQMHVRGSDRAGIQGELQVLEIPLPPGARVEEESLKRLGRAYALLPDRIVIYLADGRRGAWINLTLTGVHPGEFRVLPATIRSLERPQLFSTGRVMRMRVLSRGVASEEPYDPSPDEQYALGRQAFEHGDRELARVQLQALYRRWSEKLENEPLRETSRMLLDIAIEAGDHQSIVEHFEVLGEKSPGLYIGYEDLRAVAASYREIREHENALRIERALCIETFGKDLKVAGALSELGDFIGSTRTMRRLWLDYPDVPMVVESALTLSDRLLERAPLAHRDPVLLAAGKDRAVLTLEGILELQRFLAIYADDPQASDAALNLLSALFELEDYERSEGFAARMAAIAEDPRYVDAFLYSQAIARWHLGNDEGAKELLVRIAEAVYTDSKGRESQSENRDLALYLLGQIHHARQEYSEASAYYERVAELFSDAEEALAGFRSQRIELDEVTESLPGSDVTVELRHRNLPELELLVYPVDLMTLYLRERSLSNVAGVQLSGIAPLVQRTVKLESGVDLRDRKTTVALDLKDAGAYLVMVRAGEQFASGLVLISDLALEVDSDTDDGRVRVQVMDQATGAFERDVDVRVIGSANEEFVSGRTDPRGLFVADGIMGSGTVIARAGDRRYAFRRGVAGLPVQGGQDRSPSAGVFHEKNKNAEYFGNVRNFNVDNRAQRQVNFDKELRRERKGLQVQQVK
jgi:alpha-2-macroglobulin